LHRITHALISPTKCCVDTYLTSCGIVQEKGIKALTWHELRELGDAPCNVGPPLKELKYRLRDSPIDLQLLDRNYQLERDDFPAGKAPRAKRVKKDLEDFATAILKHRIWKGIDLRNFEGKAVNILIISHADIIHEIVGGRFLLSNVQLIRANINVILGKKLRNGEFKSYEVFEQENLDVGGIETIWVMTQGSKQRRYVDAIRPEENVSLRWMKDSISPPLPHW